MAKRILLILIALICVFSIVGVEAASESNFIDLQSYTNVHKLSEDSDVKLPFIKFFNDKALFDKKIDKSGFTMAANAVEIAEDINGFQTIIASDTVSIKGSMEYAVILASNVEITGTIEKDIFILADSVFITETASLQGDVIIMAGTVEMKGTVKGNFICNSTNLLMQGNVQNDFRVHSQNITFNEADIKGNIYIETESDLDLSEKYENAVINKIKTNVVSEAERKNQITRIVVKVITAAILFTLLNIIVRKIKPEIFTNLGKKAISHSSYAIISGVLLLTTMPIVAMLALICSLFGLGVVTTPLFIVYIAIVVVIIALAKFIVGSVMYELINEKYKVNGKVKEIGVLIGIFAALYIISYMPYISGVSTMAIVLLSSGIVMTGITRKNK